MHKIHERIIVGSEASCRNGDNTFSVIHACKSPCHQLAVGYKGNLPKNHPNYLCLQKDHDLYLNIIDPPVSLFPDELFSVFLNFAKKAWDSGKTLLIHCNKGESRAPSLALILLAKHLNVISNDNYSKARKDFEQLYTHYMPGSGIEMYLIENWEKLNKF